MFDIIKESVDQAHTIGLRQGAKLGFWAGVCFGLIAPYLVAALSRLVS